MSLCNNKELEEPFLTWRHSA